jgi:hypothetical protein
MLPTQNEDFKFQQGHIHFSGVNDPAEIVSAGSMTQLKSFQQGQDPAEIGNCLLKGTVARDF